MSDEYCDDDGDVMDLDEPERFPQFSRLPKEIRDLIWSFAFAALPGRTVVIDAKFTQNAAHSPFECDVEDIYADFAPAPALFHACWESRNRATAEAPKEFANLLLNGPIYFDFSKDTLVFNHEFTLGWFLGAKQDGSRSRRDMSPDEKKEMKLFCANIERLAIRTNIHEGFIEKMHKLWRAREISFLQEQYRHWPWPGRLDREIEAFPHFSRSESLRLAWNMAIEEDCIDVVFAEARRAGLQQVILPRFEYRDLSLMKPRIY